ncbi:hypothetical protein ABS735_05395 [Streptomyces sp. MMCC 100]|uniref:hypothetical protein n=1 Tax=Streptomyces sp. MMCC 100 TaxID=3163555 RepID=UPI003596FC8F
MPPGAAQHEAESLLHALDPLAHPQRIRELVARARESADPRPLPAEKEAVRLAAVRFPAPDAAALITEACTEADEDDDAGERRGRPPGNASSTWSAASGRPSSAPGRRSARPPSPPPNCSPGTTPTWCRPPCSRPSTSTWTPYRRASTG